MKKNYGRDTKAGHRRIVEEPVFRNPQDVSDIGCRIQKARKARGLSQEQLADRMTTDRKTVSRYERGEREMGICTFVQLADALEAEPAELLPERLSGTGLRKGKLDKLRDLVRCLPENDVDLLIMIAERMQPEM